MKYITILLLLFSSFYITGQTEHIEKLKNAPIALYSECSKTDDIKSTFCPRVQKDTLYYKHSSAAPIHDFKSVKYDIDTSLVSIHNLANMKLIEKENLKSYDLIIDYEYLDGKNGTLAKATLPNCSYNQQFKITFDNYDLPAGKNAPDSVKIYYKDTNIQTVTFHEALHNLGKSHIVNVSSIMNPYYKGKQKLTRLDTISVQLEFSKNSHIMIHRDSTGLITPNFRENEFFTQCPTDNEWIVMDKRIINLIQVIRDTYSSSIIITSSKRDYKCNLAAGGSERSRHLYGTALDFKFVNKDEGARFRKDIKNRNINYRRFINHKLKGIVLYDNHIHIDVGDHALFTIDKTNELNTSECIH